MNFGIMRIADVRCKTSPNSTGHRFDSGGPAGMALWVFMAVATMLFSLFLAAYVMRMDSDDWSALSMPRQLWISTAFLLLASVVLHQARIAAHQARWVDVQVCLAISGFCGIAFLGSQLAAWQVLESARVFPTGSPAASFFYLLTAMHGLHTAGGLAALGIAMHHAHCHVSRTRIALNIALCARYWHFLLAVWLVLFAALRWLTPDLVRFICGAR